MKIETYEEAVFTDQPQSLAVEGEMMELIESLGLDGQMEIAKPKEGGGSESLCPYRKMTKRELKVFQLCFPRQTKITEYKDSLIPLRILQVAAHAKEWFSRIQVWHPEPGHPDPVLVGYVESGWGGDPFLLARWGDALDTFEALAEKAKKIAVSKGLRALQTAQAKLNATRAILENPEGVDVEDVPENPQFYD